MNLYKQWEAYATQDRTPQANDAFWKQYFLKEQEIYQTILGNQQSIMEGTLEELSNKYNIDKLSLVGFIDGINTSLTTPIDLEAVEESTFLRLEIRFESLFYNMHVAKADWLYELSEWDHILSVERRKEIEREYKESQIVRVEKVGRNEPCPCGSGKKHKKCCGVA